MSICIIGRHGLIGGALARRYPGEVTSYPTKGTKVVYHFGSPTHVAFEENPDYHMKELLESFMYFLPYCRDHHIKFVYASSALVYEEEKNNLAFSKCKRALELIASAYPDTLGLRIFPVYGPGEHRTAISQWCAEMKQGNAPFVYGDGTQTRDFIYVEDVVDQILMSLDKTGVIDIGGGKPVSFNEIVDVINALLNKNIKPVYLPAPREYSAGIKCENPLPTKFSIYDGCKAILG